MHIILLMKTIRHIPIQTASPAGGLLCPSAMTTGISTVCLATWFTSGNKADSMGVRQTANLYTPIFPKSRCRYGRATTCIKAPNRPQNASAMPISSGLKFGFKIISSPARRRRLVATHATRQASIFYGSVGIETEYSEERVLHKCQ